MQDQGVLSSTKAAPTRKMLAAMVNSLRPSTDSTSVSPITTSTTPNATWWMCTDPMWTFRGCRTTQLSRPSVATVDVQKLRVTREGQNSDRAVQQRQPATMSYSGNSKATPTYQAREKP